VDDLERIELSAVLDFFVAAPADVVQAFDLAVLDLCDAAAFSIGAYPSMLLFNRVLGLERDAALPNIERWFASRECTFAISLRAGAELEDVLEERGYRRGQTFMKFRRGVDQPPVCPPSPRVEQIGGERAADYGGVVAAVFRWGSPVERWFAALCTRAGWACFGAFDDGRLIGTGAAHVAGTLGWLGAAGTLEDARRRGAQSALLAARIRAAGDAGVRSLATETVDRVDGVPEASFRNVVRAGFEEAYVQQWWVPSEA
jgi:GNAT superfamily N-acetyltransferase